MSTRDLLKEGVKRVLASRGLAITRTGGATTGASRGYIPAKETVRAAEQAGLSVCDYVERLWGKTGDTQTTIDRMAACGAFALAQPRVVEIGAGTGRYLEKVMGRCAPATYEVYETARDWADWLASRYPPVVVHEADGTTLKQTPSASMDLVHAHGVFVYLPFLVCYRYWKEIWRVTKPGGIVVFDIISDECLDSATVERWLQAGHEYPCFLAKPYVAAHFREHGFSLGHTFKNRYGEGESEYLVFLRR